MARRAKSLYEAGKFSTYFGEETILVPVPSSAPMRNETSPWIAKRICDALKSSGLAGVVLPIAVRRTAVAKSAYQAWGNRPTPQDHFESVEILSDMYQFEQLLLVDDIVTKGSTFLGIASRVQEAYPRANVQAFAMIRTMGLQPDIGSIHLPISEGLITRDHAGGANRDP